MKAFGTRPTYQIFAVISLVTGLIYFFFNALYLKKRPQVEGNDIVKKKPKTIAENQNGLDRGIVEIALDEKNQHRTGNEKEKKSIDALGIDNESFVKEKDISPKDSKDLETINNAKNLETIEKSSITINPEKIEGQNGLMNPNKLEGQEDEDCNITIELRPNV